MDPQRNMYKPRINRYDVLTTILQMCMMFLNVELQRVQENKLHKFALYV